ncbi:bZIP transcription factor 60 [Alnus glutinosa]|uniref:bZIP transcription factor 60 n=1 Tax=Alnus glutinosa TaxID=3517 RepID=UPI002D78C9A5|nr:bZIP transcription factor 60 [Alnus glutinosa]
MEDPDFPEDEDFIGRIDWGSLFDELPEGTNSLFPIESPVLTDSSSAEALSNPSPGPVSSWIGEIETILMKDDDDEKVSAEPSKEFCDNFLADVLLDSPGEVSGEVDKDSSTASDDGNGDWGKENVLNNDKDCHSQDDADDPHSKKRRRQLRNRDAAVRSRERKKMYVGDLEMKSRYLEAECRRLGRLLQCCYAENQALRLSLQSGNAFGAPMTKQESAVLLLESLLLGSLLWFLGIMCLFTLPTMPQLILGRVPLENVGKKNPGVRGARSKIFGYLMAQSVVKTRRCKASRTKMKPSYLVL